MFADYPESHQIPQLRQLWQEAFGDTDAFLDKFFASGYSPDRCRVVTEQQQAAAALYWFDCAWEGKKLAYLYAVATAEAFRGRGLCRFLLEDTHKLLAKHGYAGAVLSPGSRSLFRMYEKMGYRVMSTIREFSREADAAPYPVTELSPAEYARRRALLLPPGGIRQEEESLDFLTTYAALYGAEDCLLCARREKDTLFVAELLGNTGRAGGIARYFDCREGVFRTPGEGKPFAMYFPLTGDSAMPAYLGHAFD